MGQYASWVVWTSGTQNVSPHIGFHKHVNMEQRSFQTPLEIWQDADSWAIGLATSPWFKFSFCGFQGHLRTCLQGSFQTYISWQNIQWIIISAFTIAFGFLSPFNDPFPLSELCWSCILQVVFYIDNLQNLEKCVLLGASQKLWLGLWIEQTFPWVPKPTLGLTRHWKPFLPSLFLNVTDVFAFPHRQPCALQMSAHWVFFFHSILQINNFKIHPGQ